MFNYSDQELIEKIATFTATEINQQPKTWLKTVHQIKEEKQAIQSFINDILSQEDYDIILTGAGTSEFVGNALFSYLNKQFNYKVKSYATTELVATPENYISSQKPTLLVSFGRSGNSPESIGALDVAEVVSKNVKHLFITCNPDGQLSTRAKTQNNAYSINLTPETHDQSFAMTSSYSNMYLATLLVFNLDSLDCIEKPIKTIVEQSTQLLEQGYQVFKTMVESYDFKRIVYLGSNNLKGIAQESALKMLELTAGLVVTMHDSPLGFRHGPKSIIDENTLIVVFLSDDDYIYRYELDLISEMSAQRNGNRILAISNIERPEIVSLVDYYYTFNSKIALNNVFLGLEYIITAQLIALFKSIAYKITPDNPCPSGNVNRVVKGVNLYPYIKENN